MKKRKLDELDEKILAYLSKDAGVSNRKIAADFGVTEGTIRGRIKRLQEDKVIRITAVTDMSDFQKPILSYIGVHTEHTKVKEVAEKLAKNSKIRFVATTLGRYNILAITLMENAEDLIDFVNDEIVTIAGVKHTETSLGMKFIKYDYRWGRILDE